MKKYLLLFFYTVVYFFAECQTKQDMINAIRKLHIEDISNDMKDTLFLGKPFYPSSNDSEYVEVYRLNIDTILKTATLTKDTEIGTRFYAHIQVKFFRVNTNQYKVLLAYESGVSITVNIKTQKLLVDKKTQKFLYTNLEDFYRPVNDSINLEYHLLVTFNEENEDWFKYTIHTFNLSYYDDGFTEKHLKGDTIYYKWIKNKFIKLKPCFDY
jgi:hypothetical protein